MIEAAANTDREIWREREGDFYADSVHVTADGRLGINVGGTVYVRPLRRWHELAALSQQAAPAEPVAHLHKFRKITGGRRYEQANLGGPNDHPDCEDGFEWTGSEPLYTTPPAPEAPTPLNLNDKAVQKRMAAQWGFAPLPEAQAPDGWKQP
jgi:hypothetical protein